MFRLGLCWGASIRPRKPAFPWRRVKIDSLGATPLKSKTKPRVILDLVGSGMTRPLERVQFVNELPPRSESRLDAALSAEGYMLTRGKRDMCATGQLPARPSLQQRAWQRETMEQALGERIVALVRSDSVTHAAIAGRKAEVDGGSRCAIESCLTQQAE